MNLAEKAYITVHGQSLHQEANTHEPT